MSSPVPDGPPLTSADAARALCEFFLANADRGNHAANDELVAALVQRIRDLQSSTDTAGAGGCHDLRPDTAGGAPPLWLPEPVGH